MAFAESDTIWCHENMSDTRSGNGNERSLPQSGLGRSCDAYELFEVSGDELRTVICDDSRSCIGVLFSASLDNRFDIDLLHFLADFPMNNREGTRGCLAWNSKIAFRSDSSSQ